MKSILSYEVNDLVLNYVMSVTVGKRFSHDDYRFNVVDSVKSILSHEVQVVIAMSSW